MDSPWNWSRRFSKYRLGIRGECLLFRQDRRGCIQSCGSVEDSSSELSKIVRSGTSVEFDILMKLRTRSLSLAGSLVSV